MSIPPTLVAEIHHAALRHNLRLVRDAIGPDLRICPVIKANAYGHGVEHMLPVLRTERIRDVAVATIEEAIELRDLKWAGTVLIFGRPVLAASPHESKALAEEAVRRDLTCTIVDRAEAATLAAAARRVNRPATVHVKVDSGMGRAGLTPPHAVALLDALRSEPSVRVTGVYTHFAASEDPDLAFAETQLAAFRDAIVSPGAAMAGDRPTRHAANTAAIFRLPASHFDMVRPGVGFYGYWPDPNLPSPVPLRPCLRLVAPLKAIRRVPKGRPVGYNCTFVTPRDSVLGLVPIGYADGYLRSLSNRAVMTLITAAGRRVAVPVVGRVSMDQTVVDLTDAGEVREADRVVVIDDDPDAPNSVSALARLMNTIPYEVTCGLGRRVRRVAVDRDDWS